MAKTEKGIIYPNDYSDIADIPEAMKEMAESIDEVIDENSQKEEVTNLKNRVSKTESDILDIASEQITQNNAISINSDKIGTIETDVEQTKTDIANLNTNKANKNEVYTKTEADDLLEGKADNEDIPTKTSDLSNDSGFIDNTVDNLLNYYKKNETFTKQEVNDLISAITTMDLRVVQALPTEDISRTTIYLVPKAEAETQNAYDEYIYVSNDWEFIGSTDVDLTDYVKNTDYATSQKGGVFKTSDGASIYIQNGLLLPQNVNYANYLIKSNYSFISKGTLENVIEGKELINNTILQNEVTARQDSDIALQNQIDAITSASDVVDVVGTYTELQNYDTTKLTDKDLIKVLQDSTHNNALSYYRWVSNVWSYVGSEGPFYTKGEADTLYNAKQNTIDSSHKLQSDLVDDTNQTNKFTTANEKETWNGKYNKPNGGIPKTDLASDVQTSLGKADSAIQQHQDISGKEDTTNKVTILSPSVTDTQYPSAKLLYDNFMAFQYLLPRRKVTSLTSWENNGTGKKCTITDSDINSYCMVLVSIDYSSYEDAINAGISEAIYVFDGGFTVYADSVPSNTVSISYTIIR